MRTFFFWNKSNYYRYISEIKINIDIAITLSNDKVLKSDVLLSLQILYYNPPYGKFERSTFFPWVSEKRRQYNMTLKWINLDYYVIGKYYAMNRKTSSYLKSLLSLSCHNSIKSFCVNVDGRIPSCFDWKHFSFVPLFNCSILKSVNYNLSWYCYDHKHMDFYFNAWNSNTLPDNRDVICFVFAFQFSFQLISDLT